jgi:hypothetical protein
MPVGTGNCVVNIICKKFEDEFDGYVSRHCTDAAFDYSILKSGAEYSVSQFKAVTRLFDDYSRRLKDYMVFVARERIDSDEAISRMIIMRHEFRNACDAICSNAESLCDMLLDVCYRKSCTKQFVWSICGEEIVANLLKKNGNMINFPVLDDEGDIEYGGNMFTFMSKEIGGAE